MKRSRLFTRVLWVVVALFATSAVVSGALAARALANTLDRQYRSKGATIAETIAGACARDLLLNDDVATVQDLVDQYRAIEGVAYIIVRDQDGDVLAHTFAPRVPAELRAAAKGGEAAREVRFGGKDYLDIRASILDGALGEVQVGMNQELIDRAFWRTVRRQGLFQGLIGLAAVTLAYFLVRRISQPLTQLTRQARKVASLESLFAPTRSMAEDLAPIAQRGDEVGQLARSFAHMVEALAAREQHLKWAEESIRRSEQHYRSLIENVSDVIVLLDGVGNATYVSPSLEALTGFKPAEWQDRDVTLLVHPDDRDAFRQAIEACLGREKEGKVSTPGEAASVEARMLRADGTVRIIDASLTNLLFDPNVAGVVLTVRDISDRKRTLELNQAREQAEEASRLKSQLLANISHEFYTPMHHILQLTDLTLDTEVTEEQRENLQLLRESAGELFGILTNILDFSNLEADKLRLEDAPFGISQLLHDVIALLRPRAEQKGLALTADVDADVPELLRGDADRVRQVLLQVLGNALKFTSRGEIAVGVKWSDGVLAFRVRDTGIGIPAEKLRVIFEPFVQGDGSLTRRFGGTGLGLAVARSLVERMGGKLTVESTPGQGSVFRFSVRAAVESGEGGA